MMKFLMSLLFLLIDVMMIVGPIYRGMIQIFWNSLSTGRSVPNLTSSSGMRVMAEAPAADWAKLKKNGIGIMHRAFM